MSMNEFNALYVQLNILWIYGTVALLTLAPIVFRSRLFNLPRPIALCCWYAVILLATSWLLFHAVYYFTHNPRDAGLVVMARTLSFVPVYVCGFILGFFYPKKRTIN